MAEAVRETLSAEELRIMDEAEEVTRRQLAEDEELLDRLENEAAGRPSSSSSSLFNTAPHLGQVVAVQTPAIDQQRHQLQQGTRVHRGLTRLRRRPPVIGEASDPEDDEEGGDEENSNGIEMRTKQGTPSQDFINDFPKNAVTVPKSDKIHFD